MFKSIFFDFDGTLVSSIEVLYKAYELFLKRYDIEATKSEFQSLNGPTIKEVVAILREKYNLIHSEDTLLKEYNVILSDAYSEVSPVMKDLLGYLEELKSTGISLYLVTSGIKSIVEKFLIKENLIAVFSGFTYGDEVRVSKPDPYIYQLSLEKFGYQASNVLIVEDSFNGIISGKAAGIKVAALTGTHDRQFLAKTSADFIIDQISQISSILRFEIQ